MPLSEGSRLGPYEVESAIGAGGMGEVYRARDTRLDRTVAIKVLPTDLSSNPALLQRFEREARAVSSLNHPHICTLHDVGEQDGVHFLVMELIEGETLASRLEKGAFPREKLLQVGTQIAEALSAAHKSGIVHRDLKPGNIMLTDSGVKLLDFGLAKTAEAGGGPVAAALSGLATAAHGSQPLTQEGTILGTFQYMAPEQLEGKDADARSDIFAFGAILYEMATGKKAFEGESQASLISSIMTAEPPPISSLQPMTPPALDHVVRSCLAKRPDDRIQTAHDVGLQLRWIQEASSQAGVPVPVATRRKTRERIAWIVAAVLAVVALALVIPRFLNQSQPQGPVRLTMLPPAEMYSRSWDGDVAVSPDGSMIAVVLVDSTGKNLLWMRRLGSTRGERVSSLGNVWLPFWSPDNQAVGYFQRGKLHKTSLVDGTDQLIYDSPAGRGGTWNKDDVIVFNPSSAGPLYRISANGGEITQVTHLDTSRGQEAHRFPFFLPDGKHFLYVVLPGERNTYETWVGSLDSEETKLLIKSQGGATFAGPRHLLFARQNVIFAQEIDLGRLEVKGDAIPIGEAPEGLLNFSGCPTISASMNGVLARPRVVDQNTQIVLLDREGHRFGEVALPVGNFLNPQISPDGSRIVVEKYDGATEIDLWTVDLRRGVSTRLTFHPAFEYAPEWSSDGKRIIFSSDRRGKEDLYFKDASGSGESVALPQTPPLFKIPTHWPATGQDIVYEQLESRTGWDIWLMPKDLKSEPRPFMATPFNETGGHVSPDGRWIAYFSNESGSNEVYVQSFPQAGSKYRVTTDGAVNEVLRWRRDGKELLYLARDFDRVMSVPVQIGETFAAGTPEVLFRVPPRTESLEISPDAETFLVAMSSGGSQEPVISVVLNWTEALTR